MMEIPREVARELAAAPPAGFTAQRKAVEQRLRSSGDATTAAAVAKLRKPSLALWALNRLAADDVDGLAAAINTFAALSDAQARVTGGERDAAGEMRERSREWRSRQRSLIAAAQRILEEDGHPASAETLRRLETMLGDGLTGPDRDRLLDAALLAEPRPAEAIVAEAQRPSEAAVREAEIAREREAARRRAEALAARAAELQALLRRREARAAELRRELSDAEVAEAAARDEWEAAQAEWQAASS